MSSMDDVRFRKSEPRPRRLAALAASLLMALLWGGLLKSPWTGVMALALAAIPVFFARSPKLGFLTWAPLAFLVGGSAAAIALLTGHASVP